MPFYRGTRYPLTTADRTLDLRRGLVVYAKLDDAANGTRLDARGSNNFTDNNTVGVTTGPFGGNAALMVAANSEYLSLADNAEISWGDNDMAGVILVNLVSEPGQMGIVSKWGDGYEFRTWYDSDRFKFTAKGTNETTVTADNFGGVSTGVWSMIRWVSDTVNDLIKIGVNNGPWNTASHALGMNDSAGTLRLGLHDTSYLDGALSHLMMWKGRIPTDDDFNWLYNGGAFRRLY